MCEFLNTIKLIVIAFFAIHLVSVDASCLFNQYATESASHPAFVQKIGRESLILPVKVAGIFIHESSFVEVYCPHGFRRDDLSSGTKEQISEESKSVHVTCISGKIMGQTKDMDFYSLEPEDKLSCKRPAISIYETHHLMCGGVSYVLGMEYALESIILAEICYDLDTMKTKYQNYKSLKRSPVISHQNEYSPILFYPFGEGPVDIPSTTFTLPIEMIQNDIQDKVGVVHGSVEYIYEELIPENAFDPYFTDPLFSANFLGKILWWKGLKKGNWKLFETVLKMRSQHESYDVVLGTSGTVMVPASSPDCDLMKEFSFEVNSITQSAPMFTWAYLIADNYTLREEFVVIGVNSPYFEFFPRYDTILCRDMCDRIGWLAPLNKFRNISAFGYIYCCYIDDVRYLLEGIPNIYLKRQQEYESRPRANVPEYRPETEADSEETYDNTEGMDNGDEPKEDEDSGEEKTTKAWESWFRKK